MRRVDPDIFYDTAVVGAVGIERRGHRGIGARAFFSAHDPLAGRPHFMVRLAHRPWLFAALLFGFGFFAVFVRQADIVTQIILGAPIFEEMLKFGLALVIALAVTSAAHGIRRMATGRKDGQGWDAPAWLALRLPVALAVGAGFGFLEHAVTYSGEGPASYAWRVAFHALATGTSMVAYHAALASPDVRTRWLALIPSIFIHYLNNYAALVLGVASFAACVLGTIAAWWSHFLVVSLALVLVVFLVAPAPGRRLLERLATRLPVETARGA